MGRIFKYIVIGLVLWAVLNALFGGSSGMASSSNINTASVTPIPTYTVRPTSTPTAPLTNDYSTYSVYPTDTPYDYTFPTPIPQNNYIAPSNRTCTTNGDYTTCSDGSSYLRSGSFTSVNGGSNTQSGSCITTGGYTSCSDGSSAIQNGNFKTYSGNGTSGSCITNGAWTNCSDGSSTYNPNY